MRLFIVTGRGVISEAPPLTVRPALCVGYEQVTVSLAPEVVRAINEAQRASLQVLRVALAPFGLSPYDIAMPEYRRVVYEHEIDGRASR